MTMIVEHGATVIPFSDALPRAPKRPARLMTHDGEGAQERSAPDNVIVLAQFARQGRRSHRRFRPGTPPDGEAA
jgi:hypothetical protein